MKRPDIYTILIVTMIVVSTGHVGQLFAQRESRNAWALGYVMAVALDGVLVVSLYQTTTRSSGWARAIPTAVFLLACAVSGGFNYQYYVQNYPSDPPWVSLTLGVTAPVLAALVAVLRGLRANVEEEGERKAQESERQQELDHILAMETLKQSEESKRMIAVGVEKEKTKQGNAAVRLAKVKEVQRQEREIEQQEREEARQAVENLGVYKATFLYFQENPSADRATAADELGVSKRTITNHLKYLREKERGMTNGMGTNLE